MRRTLDGRRWRHRLLVGLATAVALAVVAPSGVALAQQPLAAVAAEPKPEPKPEPAPKPAPKPSSQPDAPASSAAPKPDEPSSGATPPTTGSQPRDAAAQTREEALQQQQASDRAAEQQARAQAAAEEQANRLAAAAGRARASWDSHARPKQLVIVRQRSVDMVANGRLTRQVPRRGGVLTLATLDRYLPAGWLTIDKGAAQLSAAVVLSPGVGLTVDDSITTLKLAGGATPADAASIYTGRGRIAFTGVTVTSSDPATGAALPAGPGRPFIVVATGGRLDATDATFSDLGTVPTDPADRAAVNYGEGSSGSVVRTSLLRNSTGLKLDRTQNMRLEGVTLTDSAGDGLILRGDVGTAMSGITADRNGGNGVLVTGPSSDRPITGITATGNSLFGVATLGQTKPQLSGITTRGGTVGGLRLSFSTEVSVTDFTSTDDPIGVYTHVGSSQVVLDRLRITGARRGLQIEKTTKGLQLNRSTIERASVAGVSVGGHDVELRDTVVNESGTGVRVERGAGEVTADGLTLTGGKDGIVALSATKNVVLRNVVADGVTNDAVRTFSQDAQIIGGRISGSTTGIDAGAATTISGIAITEVDEGIRARTGELVHVDGIDVSAISAGINAAPGSPVVLTGSRVDALEAVRGEVQLQGANQLSLPPLNLLGAIGVPLILLALVLEQVQAIRQRSFGGEVRRLPPSLPA